jgi:hypothetical protein
MDNMVTAGDLDEAANMLDDWESWSGEFERNGCSDPDQTLEAYRLMGQMIAIQVIMENPRPMEYAAELIERAREMVHGEEEEE